MKQPQPSLDDQMHAYGRDLAAARAKAAPAAAPMTDDQARRNRAAAEADEVFSEGRKHRNTLPNRKT